MIDGRWLGILICLAIALVYTVLSGFWGVVMTDLVQFVIAMAGAIVLAVIAWRDIGGAEPLRARLSEQFGAESDALLAFLPTGTGLSLPLSTFAAFLAVNWWATRQIDGGNIITQRMLATRDERQSVLATLWFAIAHYVIRPWPWIIVALVSLVVFPELDDPETGYPLMILEYLPTGWLGIMVASFLAAFMSTIDSQVNWGSSLLVNDLYRPFLRRGREPGHYVTAARLVSVALMAGGGVVAYLMTSVVGGWQLFYGLTAGIGGVYVGRWLWWRVSAWSEIAAWIASGTTYLILQWRWSELGFGWHLIITALVSTAAWLLVTAFAPPTTEEKLLRFYERVRPASPWWGPIARRSDTEVASTLGADLVTWLAGVVLIFTALFGLGKLLLFGWVEALPFFVTAVAASWVVKRSLDRADSPDRARSPADRR